MTDPEPLRAATPDEEGITSGIYMNLYVPRYIDADGAARIGAAHVMRI